MIKTIAQILQLKGREVFRIAPDASLYDALKMMADKGVGALVVSDETGVVGIYTERDHVRKVDLGGLSAQKDCVRQVMSAKVCYVTPETTVDEGMALMTENRCRHLPVMQNGELVGLVSIGDLVKASLDEKEFVIQQLQCYIKEGR